MKYRISYIIIILLILFLFILINNNNLINGGILKNTLEYYDIKKYFKCDFVEGKDILEQIKNK